LFETFALQDKDEVHFNGPAARPVTRIIIELSDFPGLMRPLPRSVRALRTLRNRTGAGLFFSNRHLLKAARELF
jgi:hypothetical protein